MPSPDPLPDVFGAFSTDFVYCLSYAHFSTAGSASSLRNVREKVAENAHVKMIGNPVEILCNLLRKTRGNPVDGLSTPCAEPCGKPAQNPRISGGIHTSGHTSLIPLNCCKCEYLPTMLCSFCRRPQDVVVIHLTPQFSRRSLFPHKLTIEWGRGSDEEIRAVVSSFRAESAPVGLSSDSRVPGHREGQIAGSAALGTSGSSLSLEL